jgi:hypothetical protein
MGMDGKLHALITLFPGKEANAPTAKKDGWIPKLFWMLLSGEITLALLAIEP